jgi:hypothetical protein
MKADRLSRPAGLSRPALPGLRPPKAAQASRPATWLIPSLGGSGRFMTSMKRLSTVKLGVVVIHSFISTLFPDALVRIVGAV